LAKDYPATLAADQAIAVKFWEKLGWNPVLTRIFPRATKYSEYEYVKRKALQDCESTDWDEVRKFARRFLNLLSEVKNGPSPPQWYPKDSIEERAVR
jgi:menaquinone-dependent protoporphyrinogen IX oxidase